MKESTTAHDDAGEPLLRVEEIRWLADLARGTTVHELALDADLTDGEIYRRLNDIYVRLGVRNRTEAVKRVFGRGLP
ncbi:MAG: hypothetical protein ACLGHL_04780 [Actinomycetota bacterium]